MKSILPNTFKFTGLGIGLFIALAMVVTRFIDPTLLQGDPILRDILTGSLSLSLLVAILSKDKVENEEVSKLRSQALSFAFLFGILFGTMSCFHLFESSSESRSSVILILMMETMFLSHFTFLKMKAKRMKLD